VDVVRPTPPAIAPPPPLAWAWALALACAWACCRLLSPKLKLALGPSVLFRRALGLEVAESNDWEGIRGVRPPRSRMSSEDDMDVEEGYDGIGMDGSVPVVLTGEAERWGWVTE
jgi:hypothetical protein